MNKTPIPVWCALSLSHFTFWCALFDNQCARNKNTGTEVRTKCPAGLVHTTGSELCILVHALRRHTAGPSQMRPLTPLHRRQQNLEEVGLTLEEFLIGL